MDNFMEKKEFHRANLPHFQQPGQAYFVTWNLHDAIPAKALQDYTQKLKLLRNNIDFAIQSNRLQEQISELKFEYNILRKKMMKAFEDLLHIENKSVINLSKPHNTQIVINALRYWEDKRLENFAICVMPNHVHWVFKLLEEDKNGNPVWLDDVLKSVKQYSATQINKQEKRAGMLWHKESWDTTIRDDRHLYEAIEYTRNNPVKAGLVTHWSEWEGTMIFE
jgi:REP element-mobilizing transposase RayT